jgi:hypothetical protein
VLRPDWLDPQLGLAEQWLEGRPGTGKWAKVGARVPPAPQAYSSCPGQDQEQRPQVVSPRGPQYQPVHKGVGCQTGLWLPGPNVCCCPASVGLLSVSWPPCSLCGVYHGKPGFEAGLPGGEEPLRGPVQVPKGPLPAFSAPGPPPTKDHLGLVGSPCHPGDRGDRDSGDRDSGDRGYGGGVLLSRRAASPGVAGRPQRLGEAGQADCVSLAGVPSTVGHPAQLARWHGGAAGLPGAPGR